MRTETLTIVAPCDWINANQGGHWTKRAYLVKTWRHASAWACRQRRIKPFTGQVDVLVIVHKASRSGGRWDPANIGDPTGKALIDGLVDAGVLVDDDHKHLRRKSSERGEQKSRNAITLVITEVEAEQVAS